MYKFCRVDLFGKTSKWVLVIDTFEKLKEWNEKYHNQYLRKGVDDIKTRAETWEKQKQGKYPNHRLQGHWTSEVGFLSEVAGGNEKELDLIEGFNTVVNDLIDSKFQAFKNEGSIYVYETCQWFTRPENCAIVEEIDKDEMVYPKYTKDDIKVTKWEGGRHYYATISSVDVVDEFGDRKWNTYETAYNKALKMLEKL